MSFLLTVLSGLNFVGGEGVIDDFTDRLHYKLSSGLLIALAILVSWKQFGGKPVECMVPETFTGAWEDYAEHYCFAMDTYFLPMDQSVAETSIEDRKQKHINYYQWVPFILLIEAACFRLPYMAWKVLAHHSGIRVHDLVGEASDKKNLDGQVRKSTIETLSLHLENALRFHRRLFRRKLNPHDCVKIMNLPYTSSYISLMFVCSKILYLANACTQFFLMNIVLETGGERDLYGWGVMYSILNGTSWESSGVFPRVTLCDYEVRTMGNVQRYTMQCVLVINMLNEKIFIFLWFWYNLLILLTLASIVYWTTLLVLPCFSRTFVSRHLELCEMPFDAKESAKDVERFCSSYLHKDGIFVIRMIEMHTGVIFGTDLIMSLWKSFYKIEETVSIWSGQTDSRPSQDTPKPEDLFGRPPPPINHKAKGRQRPQQDDDEEEDMDSHDRAGLRWRRAADKARESIDQPDSGGGGLFRNPNAAGVGRGGGRGGRSVGFHAPPSAPALLPNQKPGNRFFPFGGGGRKEHRNMILTPEHLQGSSKPKPRMTVIEDSRPKRRQDTYASPPNSPEGVPLPPPATAPVMGWGREGFDESVYGSAVSTRPKDYGAIEELPRRTSGSRSWAGLAETADLDGANIALLPPIPPINMPTTDRSSNGSPKAPRGHDREREPFV